MFAEAWIISSGSCIFSKYTKIALTGIVVIFIKSFAVRIFDEEKYSIIVFCFSFSENMAIMLAKIM